MKRKIIISVAGLTATGKSSIMAIIKDALMIQGHENIKIEDIDGEKSLLKARQNYEMISHEMDITIRQYQLNREALEEGYIDG